MATYEELIAKARELDAAGNTEDAKRLAGIAKGMKSGGPQVIATTEDGGKVYRDDQGNLSFANAEYATSDPEQIKRIMQGATPADVSQAGPVTTGGAMMNAARHGFQGLTLGRGDELTAGVTSLFGNSYDTELNRERARLSYGKKDNPKSSLVAEIAGALALPMGAVTKGSLPARIAKSAGVGAGLSGLYGFNASEDDEQLGRLKDALKPAAIGGAIGGLIPIAGAGLQKVMDARKQSKVLNAIRKTAPSTDDLHTQGTAAYKAVDDAGVAIDTGAFRGVTDDILSEMRTKGLDEGASSLNLTPQSKRLAEILGEATDGKNSVPFSEIDQLRRKAGIPASNPANKVESALGSTVITKLDDFIDNIPDTAVAYGDAANLGENIRKARSIWQKMSKSQLIDDAIDAGGNYLSGTGSGIRWQFKRILNSPKLSRGFTEAEKKVMSRVANGTIPEKMLQLAGGGMGNLATMAGGAAVGGIPGAILGAVTAAGARLGSDALTKRNAEIARALVAQGGMTSLPVVSPVARNVVEALTRRGTAAALN